MSDYGLTLICDCGQKLYVQRNLKKAKKVPYDSSKDKTFLENVYLKLGLSKTDVKYRCDPQYIQEIECPKCKKVFDLDVTE